MYYICIKNNDRKCTIYRSLAILLIFVSVSLSADDRPNILFCISDDQSYAHTGANGDPVIKTPGFDRIANEGIRFTNPYCDAPTCGPSRSAILTGQHIWRLEEAGNIHSTLPAKFETYTDLLGKAGYSIGHTGKGWGPGNLEVGGRSENPAGPGYQKIKMKKWKQGINSNSYAANFNEFIKQLPEDAPFCFWLGTYEPHRFYEKNSGKKSGKDPAKVNVPPIFPDTDVVRSDILDYMTEVEHFDSQVVNAINILEKCGKLENTIIIATSDHGMPFPRAKATLYDDGSKVPLAIRWPQGINNPGRTYNDFVNLSDLAPTFLEAAGVTIPNMMTGKSLMPILKGEPQKRQAAFIAMERHDGCRAGGKGYPSRAIRTKDYLYIINFYPERWPAGDPDKENCARYMPFGEVDPSPTKTLLMEKREEYKKFYDLAFAKRPGVELYDLSKDPGQVTNIAGESEYVSVQAELEKQLKEYLIKTKDPRLTGGEVLWDFYPYYGRIVKDRKKEWAVDPQPQKK